jgi:prepilin-type N-terminal cleavage/methylation domain-containing protein
MPNMKPAARLGGQTPPCAAAGFTLIEMVVVLVMMGILAVVSAPHLVSLSAATLDSQTKAFASDLRRVQLLASVKGVSLCVQASGTHYNVVQCAQPAVPFIDPATGLAFAGDFKNGVMLTNPVIAPTLAFNSLGEPNHATRFIVSADTSSFSVDIAAVTGYVSVTQAP